MCEDYTIWFVPGVFMGNEPFAPWISLDGDTLEGHDDIRIEHHLQQGDYFMIEWRD